MRGFFLDQEICEATDASGMDDLPESLGLFQLSRLRETISYAKERSPFYRKHMRNLDPEEITGFDSFKSSVPFTSAEDIRERGMQLLCTSQNEIERVVTLESSGTTASPKRLFFTSEDIEYTIRFFCQVLSKLSKEGESAVIMLPGNRPSSAGDLLKRAFERIGVNGVVTGIVDDFRELAADVAASDPSVIIGMPVHLLALSEFLKKESGFREREKRRNLIVTSDYASPSLKKRIMENMRCNIFDHYGMTEMALGGAIDCHAHSGYHLRECDIFFEIVDPSSGLPVEDGKWGEITVTTLNREGMPLIRYRTGDISRFIKGSCGCGTTLRRMDYVRYRQERMIQLPDGSRFGMADLDDLIFAIEGVVDFTAAIVSSERRYRLEIVMKFIDKGASGRIYGIDPVSELTGRALRSPVLKKAFEKRILGFGSIGKDIFRPFNSYTLKRKIEIETPDSHAPL